MEKNILSARCHAAKGKDIARAIDHKTRFKIIQLLLDNGEMNVTDIYTHREFRDRSGKYMEQSECSQHLATLRRANLVKVEKNGKERLYSINHAVYNEAISLFQSLSNLLSAESSPNGHARMTATSLSSSR